MLPLLLVGIAASGAALLIKELLKDEIYSDMSNTHEYFIQFEKNISLSPSKKKKLIASRKALENRILDFFKHNINLPKPFFYIQGSYKMKTIIMDADGMYDVDLGIYFLTKPTIQPQTLQKYIYEAVEAHTQYGTEFREKCIRVIYSGDFDIDLPVYYKSTNDSHPFLATKKGWIESDPKELCDWLENKKDVNGQLIRIIKYLKAWANVSSRKMPSGIAFTVWAASCYKKNTRDDIALYETIKAIKESFFGEVSCKNPTTPNDDLISKLTSQQKKNFIKEFDEFISDAEEALKAKDTFAACQIWQRQFRERFPS